MDTLKKIEEFRSKKKYVRLTRERGAFQEIDRGYIISYSSDFVLLHTTDDFTFNGYSIFPLDTIVELRHNKYERFYDRIMKLEHQKKNIGIPYNLELSTWKSLFQSLKKTKLTVTIKCEEPHLDYFCIGTLKQVGEKQVSMLYFSPDGILDDTPTVTKYVNITRVEFDDRYANIMSKYLVPKE